MLRSLIAILMSLISLLTSTAGSFGGAIIDCLFQRNSYEVYENLRYGENERDILDIYVPKSAARRSDNGCILFIHGGGWTAFDKETIEYYCEQFSKDGYITAALNYTLYSDATADWFSSDVILDEISAAVAFIKSFSDENDLHITKLATSGYSAGAHLSMLYSFTRGDTGAIPVVFTANLAGPADLSYEIWGDEGIYWATILFGSERAKEYINEGRLDEVVRYVSPAYHVNANTPPTLLAQGKKDSLVPYANAQSVADAFEAAGAKCELWYFPNSDHDFAGDPKLSTAFDKQFLNYCKIYFGY